MPIQKIPKEDILGVIENLGPSQPIDIRKSLKQGDSYLIGAMLSEFVAEGMLGISKVRRGGSPFYYLASKPQTLNMISKYLNEKDRRTYALLKEHLVLREDAQDPLVRVGLQNMPDFSKPLEVNGVNYWKYFLVTDESAKKIIKQNGVDTNTAPLEKPEEMDEEAQTRSIENEEDQEKPIALMQKNEEDNEEDKKETVISKEAVAKEDKLKKPKCRRKKPTGDFKISGSEQSFVPQDIPSSEIKPESSSLELSDSQKTSQETSATQKQKKKRVAKKKIEPAPTVTSDGSVMIAPEAWLMHDTLYSRILAFASGAIIKDQKVIKPNAQISCIITMDVPFGKIDMMIMAFNKKFTDEDLAKSVALAKDRGLPILLLSVDSFPSKMTSTFKGFSNVLFKQFETKPKA